MGKSLLVVTNLPATDKRYKRFVKLLNRKANIIELWPGAWFVKVDRKPDLIAERLSGLFEDGEGHTAAEQFIITTVGPDFEHLNGWLHVDDKTESAKGDPWKWIRES